MKTEHRYRWKVIERGKPRITDHITEERVITDYPWCNAERVLDSLKIVEVPTTEAEMLAASDRIQLGHGPARCQQCLGERWLCVDHLVPWPHEGCDAEGKACVCNPNAEVAWREVYADNTPKGEPQ